MNKRLLVRLCTIALMDVGVSSGQQTLSAGPTLSETMDWISATANAQKSVKFAVGTTTMLSEQVGATAKNTGVSSKTVASHNGCIVELVDYASMTIEMGNTVNDKKVVSSTWHENRWKVDFGKLAPSLTMTKAVTAGNQKVPCIEGQCTWQAVSLKGIDSQFQPIACTDKQPSDDPVSCLPLLTAEKSFSFRFKDIELANRFATAIKAAIQMCGGKDVNPNLY